MGSVMLPFFIGTNKVNKNELKKLVKEEIQKIFELEQEEEDTKPDVKKRAETKAKLSALAAVQKKINTPDEAEQASLDDIASNLQNVADTAKNRVLLKIIQDLKKQLK